MIVFRMFKLFFPFCLVFFLSFPLKAQDASGTKETPSIAPLTSFVFLSITIKNGEEKMSLCISEDHHFGETSSEYKIVNLNGKIKRIVTTRVEGPLTSEELKEVKISFATLDFKSLNSKSLNTKANKILDPFEKFIYISIFDESRKNHFYILYNQPEEIKPFLEIVSKIIKDRAQK